MGWLNRVRGGAPGELKNGAFFYAHDDARVRQAFFYALYTALGRLAKIDGRVCDAEIAMVEQIMDDMLLSAEQRDAAIRLFGKGKAPEFSISKSLDSLLRREARRSLLRRFLEQLLNLAFADGELNPPEQVLLQQICERLEFSRLEYQHMEETARSQGLANGGMRISDAYEVLGVETDASNEELNRNYRRLIGQYHPDRLLAQGGDESLVREGTEKSRQVKLAFELIRRQRGF